MTLTATSAGVSAPSERIGVGTLNRREEARSVPQGDSPSGRAFRFGWQEYTFEPPEISELRPH